MNMEKNMDKVINNLPEDMNGTALSPAAEPLFKTGDHAVKLDKEQANLCHHVTAHYCAHAKGADPT